MLCPVCKIRPAYVGLVKSGPCEECHTKAKRPYDTPVTLSKAHGSVWRPPGILTLNQQPPTNPAGLASKEYDEWCELNPSAATLAFRGGYEFARVHHKMLVIESYKSPEQVSRLGVSSKGLGLICRGVLA